MNEENVVVTKVYIERECREWHPKVVLQLEGLYCCVLTFELKKIEALLDLFGVNALKNIEGKACRIITDGNIGKGIKHLWKTDEVMT